MSGDTLLTGGLLLAVMIVPTVMTLADDALSGVPAAQRMAARALGLTRAETALQVAARQAFPGLVSAALLGLGPGARRDDRRVPGDRPPGQPVAGAAALLQPLASAGQTLTTKLGGSETFIAYGDPLHWGAIMGLGLVLFAVVAVVSLAGEPRARTAGILPCVGCSTAPSPLPPRPAPPPSAPSCWGSPARSSGAACRCSTGAS